MGLRKTGSTKNEQHTWDANFLKVLTDSKYVDESQLNSEGYEAVRKTVASIIYIQSVMMTFEKNSSRASFMAGYASFVPGEVPEHIVKVCKVFLAAEAKDANAKD